MATTVDHTLYFVIVHHMRWASEQLTKSEPGAELYESSAATTKEAIENFIRANYQGAQFEYKPSGPNHGAIISPGGWIRGPYVVAEVHSLEAQSLRDLKANAAAIEAKLSAAALESERMGNLINEVRDELAAVKKDTLEANYLIDDLREQIAKYKADSEITGNKISAIMATCDACDQELNTIRSRAAEEGHTLGDWRAPIIATKPVAAPVFVPFNTETPLYNKHAAWADVIKEFRTNYLSVNRSCAVDHGYDGSSSESSSDDV